MPRAVLLDTDIGSDIDDALALCYLLAQPDCELVGVTTVTGDVGKRAALVEIVAHSHSRSDFPIVAGIGPTLATGKGQPEVPQYAPVAARPHRLDYEPNQAVDYLRRTIRSRPGEIDLLSIGPFTNLAVLLALDPEIPALCRSIISMAGFFIEQDGYEWNCLVDPAATDATLRRTSDHRLIGLDVTLQCTLTPTETRERFAHGPASIVLPMAERWFQDADKVTFHDPLAAVALFEPETVGYRRGTARVEPDGRTWFEEQAEGPHHAASTVNVDGFFEAYFRYVR